MWIYYSSQIVLFGAEFTRVYADECGTRVLPSDNAIRVPETPLARAAMEKQLKNGVVPASSALRKVVEAPDMVATSPSRKIEILLVEDSPGDVRLTREALARARSSTSSRSSATGSRRSTISSRGTSTAARHGPT